MTKARAQVAVMRPELGRIADVEIGRSVEFGMAALRRIGADAAQARDPRLAALECAREMRRVRAIEHEIGRCVRRLAIDLFDRVLQRLPARQLAVGLDRERDHDRHPRRLRRAHDADRFLDIIEREAAHHVGLSAAEHGDLLAVIIGRFPGAHGAPDFIAVATRTDVSRNDNRRLRRLVLPADVRQQFDRGAIDARERLTRITELRGPVRIGAPGVRLENKAEARVLRHGDIARVIGAQLGDAGLALHQVETREMRKVHAFVEDQRGLEPAVGEEQAIGKLRQLISIL